MAIWQKNSIRLEEFEASSAALYIDDLARLRIVNFRGYPYLYDGDFESERDYLQTYFDAPKSKILILFDGDKICGMASFVPMQFEDDIMKDVFLRLSLNPDDYLYIGELILEEGYRGLGISKIVESYADALKKEYGLKKLSLATAKTSSSDKHRPDFYRSVDDLCFKLGYKIIPNSEFTFEYKSSVTGQIEPRIMQFWEK